MLQFEVHITASRTDTLRTYVEADTREEAEAKVNAAMTVAMTTDGEAIFGTMITLSTGRIIPTRWIGEQHVREDLGFIPSFADWANALRPKRWMGRAFKVIQREHETEGKNADSTGVAE